MMQRSVRTNASLQAAGRAVSSTAAAALLALLAPAGNVEAPAASYIVKGHGSPRLAGSSTLAWQAGLVVVTTAGNTGPAPPDPAPGFAGVAVPSQVAQE